MKQRTLFQAIALVVGLAACALAQGQQPAPPPQTPSPAPGTPGGRTPNIPTPQPPSREPQRQPDFGRERPQFPDVQRPIFLSGKVILDDGTPPPDPVVIERVCNGQPRPEAYTDSRGRFSFQLGHNMSMLPDASVSSSAEFPSDPAGQTGPFGRSRTGITERELMACELRASLPGYRSDVVSLAGRRMMDNPDVGTIVLHRLGNVEGTTISATTLNAPKDAKKAYEKGIQAMHKKKLDEAQKQLEKAVQIYPQYAAAWHELGVVYQEKNNLAQAREAYGKALAADSKFMKPYLQLALIAARERKWEEVADTTERLLRLDAFDFPQAYFFNSVANFNLRRLDAAEKSAREGVKLDSQHRIPKMNHLLGVILYNKQDYSGAVEHLRTYLEHAPNAQDADTVRKQLQELERVTGQSSTAKPSEKPQP